TGSSHAPLPAPAPTRPRRVRRRLRLVQGTRKPAAPPPDVRVVPLRRACDLVDGRGGERAGRARAAADLRRRAHDGDQREPGRDPVTGPTTASAERQGGAMPPKHAFTTARIVAL